MVKSQDFGLITFEDEQIEKVVELSGLGINRRGYITEGRETKTCYICEKAVTTKRLGHIMPGSRIVCCKNPVCFAGYVNAFLRD